MKDVPKFCLSLSLFGGIIDLPLNGLVFFALEKTFVGTLNYSPAANFADYLDYIYRDKGLSRNTRLAYQQDLSNFARFIADKTMSRQEISRYLSSLSAQGSKPATVARRLASLKGWFNWRKDCGLIADDPSESIQGPQRARHLPQVLTAGEIDALLKAAKSAKERLIIELLYGAGLRVSELVNLNWSDLNLSQGSIKCFGKGSKERIVPIGKPALSAIEEYRAKISTQQRRKLWLLHLCLLTDRKEG